MAVSPTVPTAGTQPLRLDVLRRRDPDRAADRVRTRSGRRRVRLVQCSDREPDVNPSRFVPYFAIGVSSQIPICGLPRCGAVDQIRLLRIHRPRPRRATVTATSRGFRGRSCDPSIMSLRTRRDGQSFCFGRATWPQHHGCFFLSRPAVRPAKAVSLLSLIGLPIVAVRTTTPRVLRPDGEVPLDIGLGCLSAFVSSLGLDPLGYDGAGARRPR